MPIPKKRRPVVAVVSPPAPSPLTPALIEEVARYRENGLDLLVVAQLCDVSSKSLRRWLDRGEAAIDRIENGGAMDPDEEVFMLLAKRYAMATAQFEAVALTRIQLAAARGSWGASAWLLERLRPETYVKRSGPDQGQPAKNAGTFLDSARKVFATPATNAVDPGDPEVLDPE